MQPPKNTRARLAITAGALALAGVALLLLRDVGPAGTERVERRIAPIAEAAPDHAALVAPGVASRTSTPSEPVEEADPAAAAAPPAGADDDAPPGRSCIRVVVTGDGRSLGPRTVLVERTRNNWLFADALAGDRAHRVPLDAEGAVEVCGLEPGSHVVALLGTTMDTHQARVELGEERGAVVELELGAGRLFGTVVGPDGAPVEGACVTVWRRPSGHGLALAFTDAQGRYDLDGLPEGTFQASAYFDGDTYGRRQDARKATLAEGEERELDLGIGPDVHTWTGTVRTSWGDPVTAVGASRIGLSFVSTGGGAGRPADVDAEGRFEVRLRSGTYKALVRPPGHPSQISVPTLHEVGESDGAFDVVLPGARLEGRVLAAPDGASPTAAQPGEGHSVRAHLEGHTYPAAFFRVPVGRDGRYAFDGMEAGTWRIGISREPLVSYRTLRIEPGADRVTLDLASAPR